MTEGGGITNRCSVSGPPQSRCWKRSNQNHQLLSEAKIISIQNRERHQLSLHTPRQILWRLRSTMAEVGSQQYPKGAVWAEERADSEASGASRGCGSSQGQYRRDRRRIGSACSESPVGRGIRAWGGVRCDEESGSPTWCHCSTNHSGRGWRNRSERYSDTESRGCPIDSDIPQDFMSIKLYRHLLQPGAQRQKIQQRRSSAASCDYDRHGQHGRNLHSPQHDGGDRGQRKLVGPQ